MDRRDFLLASAVAAIAVPKIAASAKAPVAVEELTLADIAAAFADGRMTSRRLTQIYLDRIDALNRLIPGCAPSAKTNPHALPTRRGELDGERREPRTARATRGADSLIKDNVETADHMMTTAGSLALEGWYAPRCAPGRAPARGRRGDSRQDQPERVGKFPFDPARPQRLERPGRTDPQSLCARPKAHRVRVRVPPWRSQPTCASVAVGTGHGWLDLVRRHPCAALSARGFSTAWLVSRAGIIPISDFARHARPDGPHGAGDAPSVLGDAWAGADARRGDP